jgi:cell division protein ZapE
MHLRDGIQTHSTVAQRYAHLVEQGALRPDPAQRPLVAALDRLNDDIHAKRLAHKSSALGWLFAKNRGAPAEVKGLYIHGGVGRGKTMLMDLFFDVVPARAKRRVHFNAFMGDVHDRIQKHRQARKDGLVREDDPIPPVARALADEAWVLCFDEFSVTDIADAMILSRLFSALFANGVVLVATSNVAPDDLYRDGLNRGLFLSFIALRKRHT